MLSPGGAGLLDFAFPVDDMLADDRIVFFNFHLVGGVPLVFGGGVEMPGVSG